MTLVQNKSSILKKAFVSSLVSKVVSFSFQIFSVPILITFLGTAGFGLYSTLITIFGWVFLISGGINPGVTRVVARKGITPNALKTIDIAKRISLLFIFLILVCVLIAKLTSSSNNIYLFDAQHVLLLFCLSAPIIYLSLTDSIRQGMNEQHYNNLWATAATFISVVFIAFLPFWELEQHQAIACVILIMYSPLVLTKLANTWQLSHRDSKLSLFTLMPKSRSNQRLFKALIAVATANLIIQLSVTINKSAVMVFLANTDLNEAAKLEIAFRYFLIAGTFFATIQQPLWPLIIQAIKNREISWMQKVKKKIFAFYVAYSIALMIILQFFGVQIFNIWSNNNLAFSLFELQLIGAYFITIAINQASIVLLMGYSAFAFIGKALIVESLVLVMLLISPLFESTFADVLTALLLARFFTSSIILWLGVNKREAKYVG
ncbi:hypothetical protein [Thalassotalea atypica]|uniref:hypothetical protein n=1 Tax=Thalassotalea atypica TaxID=2054316 RepID=UPI00257272D4|nr:hypothetical protein [Thalassotalea atypica]